MRISDWSSDVCSSDLRLVFAESHGQRRAERHAGGREQLEGLFHAFHDRLEADAGAPAEADARRGVGLGLDLDELVDRAGLLAVVAGAFVHSVLSAVEQQVHRPCLVLSADELQISEERMVGKECVRTVTSWW